MHIKPSDINCSLCSEAANHGPFMGTEGQRKELRLCCVWYPSKPKKTIAQTRREAVAPKPAALRAKYAETLELARPDVHDVFRKEVAAGDGATVVEFFVNTPTAGGAAAAAHALRKSVVAGPPAHAGGLRR